MHIHTTGRGARHPYIIGRREGEESTGCREMQIDACCVCYMHVIGVFVLGVRVVHISNLMNVCVVPVCVPVCVGWWWCGGDGQDDG